MKSLCSNHLRENFWVIAVLNNPCRFKKRIQLFREFIDRMKAYNVNICLVEVVYGERNFESDDIDVPIKVQMRTDTILWQKENMVNMGISRLPPNWKYVAWIDTDVDFINKNWVNETIHQLQHHAVIQLFEDAIDLGPTDEIMNTSKSFMYCYKNNIKRKCNTKEGCLNYVTFRPDGTYWHPGYAWAARRDAIDTLGGLFEVGIVGSGDHHMACCLIGEGKLSIASGLNPDYETHVLNWEKRALRLHKNVGYIKGTIFHYWHGKKINRKYKERWEILRSSQFSPTHDLHKDWQGLLIFHEGSYKLRDDILEYFNQRNEDSIDL